MSDKTIRKKFTTIVDTAAEIRNRVQRANEVIHRSRLGSRSDAINELNSAAAQARRIAIECDMLAADLVRNSETEVA